MEPRYHRQMLLPDFGQAGQERLARAHAVVVGVGALGCAAADLLARAGVGRLTLIDRDVVEVTNLQRQTLFAEADVGTPKAIAAKARLEAVNSGVVVEAHVADFGPANVERLCGLPGSKPGVFIDGTDNFETRLLINDVAIKHGVPYVYAGAVATRGMVLTIIPGRTPCLRCIVGSPPAPGTLPTCDTVGVLGPVIAIVAGVEAAEALKVLLGRTDLVHIAMLDFDVWSNERRRLDVSALRDADCPCCGLGRYEFLEGAFASSSAVLCGQKAVQVLPPDGAPRVALEEIVRALSRHGDFRANAFVARGALADERGEEGDPIEITIFADGRAIVKGTKSTERARSIYARYVGA